MRPGLTSSCGALFTSCLRTVSEVSSSSKAAAVGATVVTAAHPTMATAASRATTMIPTLLRRASFAKSVVMAHLLPLQTGYRHLDAQAKGGTRARLHLAGCH